MPRTDAPFAALLMAAAAALTGCGGAAGGPPGGSQAQLGPAQFMGADVFPLSGYVASDARGYTLWGAAPATIVVNPVLSTGQRFIAAGPAISLRSSDPSRLTVRPGTFYGSFVLRATTGHAAGACPSCNVVKPGPVTLAVSFAAFGTARAFTTLVTVRVAHKVVAVSLNPLPNPSLGGSDAIAQYYDDNVKPSVIWDDFYLHNITSIPNVGGLAYGTDGTLYVANSGVQGVGNGTVTEYAPSSSDSTPVRTLASKKLLSPAGVAVDPNGEVYVADNGYETVTRFPLKGSAVTIVPGWSAGANVDAVAVDAAGHLYIGMTGAGNYRPSGKNRNVGTIAEIESQFASSSTPSVAIDANGFNGVNQPYGVAVGTPGNVYVVNDYVSVVNGPPGPGPIYSTLTWYDNGISRASTRPASTTSSGLVWPLAVAADLAGTVYVSNDAPPSASGKPGKIELLEYAGTFAAGAKAERRIDLGAGLPAAYGPYLLNVQGVAVYPSPLTK